MFLERFADDVAYPVWRFRTKNGAEEKALPVIVSAETRICGGFTVTKNEYTVSGGRATRVFATDGQHVSVLAEHLILDEPRSVYTSFCVPAGKEMNCNVADKNRLVLRSEGLGAKLFRLANALDGTDIMEKNGLLLPDGFSDGMVRITLYSGLYGFGCRHLAVFGLAEEQSDKIKGWHMERGDGIEISAPDKECRVRIYAVADRLTLVDPHTLERVTFLYNEREESI